MKKTNYLLLILKGCAMGAADVVPGVSGGTIAFISGIYQRLVNAIRSIDLHALRLLGGFKFKAFWEKIDGNFLASVVLGIGLSIFSLARLMTYLLEQHPIQIWSFFFGLIIASSLLVFRQITGWHWTSVLALLLGIAAAYAITVLSPASTPDTWWFVMLSGAIAICAMILPGISGAFILLLLGKYQYMMAAVGELKIGIILVFAVGAVAGIVSFSHLLSWLLKHYYNVTVALLTGFMIGSLNKVWPWKETLEFYTDSHGALKPLVETNVLPARFVEATGLNAYLTEAIIWCIVGFVLIYGIERIGHSMARKHAGREEQAPKSE